ncbi:MAG: DUF1552 domain-containing protein [Sandaracinus sp.]
MKTARPSMSRRDLLRAFGLGAGGLALAPLLSQLASAGGMQPRRFVFVVEGNCFEPVTMLSTATRAAIDATASEPIGDSRWWPNKVRHGSVLTVSPDLPTASALSPLVGALPSKAAVLFGLSSKVVGGGHSAEHGALSSARTIAGVPGSETIDAHLAALPAVRGTTPFDAVRLGVAPDPGRPLDFGTCAYGPGRAAPLMLQPEAAYNLLFGSVATDAGRLAFSRRGELLDFAAADARATLAAFPSSSVERAKIEAYLASLEELSRRQARMIELAPALMTADPGAAATPTSDAALDRFAAQMQLATAALLGGITNVCVVGCGTGGDFNVSYPGITSVGRHDLHHGSDANAAYRDAIHEVTRRQVATIAQMAATLDATPDVEGGTMLDRTVIVYVGDNGEQHHAEAREFPILLLGGSALGLRTEGQTLVFPGESAGSSHRQLSNLWNTLGYLAGEELDEFGLEGPIRVAPGPLSELMT